MRLESTALICTLLVLGCAPVASSDSGVVETEGETEGETDSETEGVTVEQYADDYAAALCEALECTCSEVSDAECRAAIADDIAAFFGEAVIAGLEFDPVCAARSRPNLQFCDPAKDDESACESCQLYAGTKARGESCESTSFGWSDCAQGLDCESRFDPDAPDLATPSLCMPACEPRAVGEACNWVIDGSGCEPGLVCADEFCRHGAALGESCASAGCEATAVCDADTLRCVALPSAGEACVSDRCAKPSECDFSINLCVELPGVGEPCYASAYCEAFLECDAEGVCIASASPEIGDTCDDDSPCASSDVCFDGRCEPGVCELLREDD